MKNHETPWTRPVLTPETNLKKLDRAPLNNISQLNFSFAAPDKDILKEFDPRDGAKNDYWGKVCKTLVQVHSNMLYIKFRTLYLMVLYS